MAKEAPTDGQKGKSRLRAKEIEMLEDEVSALFRAAASLQACSSREGIGFAHNKNNSRHHLRPKSLWHLALYQAP